MTGTEAHHAYTFPEALSSPIAAPSVLKRRRKPTVDNAIYLFDQDVNAKTLTGSYQSYSPTGWKTWIIENYPDFGTFRYDPDVNWLHSLPMEEQNNIRERTRRGGGVALHELIQGMSVAISAFNKADSSFDPIQVAFVNLPKKIFPNVAAAWSGTNVVFINIQALEGVCSYYLIHPRKVQPLRGCLVGQPIVHMTSYKQSLRLHGIEEVDHIAFDRKYKIDATKILQAPNATRAQYDGQPHELRALLHVRKYVVAHPEEFPAPTSGGPTELDILDERIREAQEECIKTYGETILKQIEKDIETIDY